MYFNSSPLIRPNDVMAAVRRLSYSFYSSGVADVAVLGLGLGLGLRLGLEPELKQSVLV